MNHIHIRSADTSDLDAITAIYAHAVLNGAASYELDPPSCSEMRGRFSKLRDGGFPYIVAEFGGHVAGYAYVGPFRPRPAYRFIVEDSVYIAPDRQGLGLGRALLERLISETRALGFRQMLAVIGDGSPQSASVKLHEALGFRHCGTLEGSGFKHGRWLNTVLMQLSMNGGNTTLPDGETGNSSTFPPYRPQ
jgi:phosphinothricin acetyltransferase